MKKLLHFMKGSYGYALAAPLFMLLEVMMDLMQPALMSQIVDVGIAQGDLPFIWATGGRMLLIAFIGLAGGLGCTISSAKAAVDFSSRLRQAVFDRIQTFSYVELDHFQTASLITRLTSDVTQIQNIVLMGLRIMVRAPLLCLGGMMMVYLLSPGLSLVLVASLPLMLLTAAFFIRKTMPLFLTMQMKIDRVNAVMRENLLGVKVVKSFVAEGKEQQRFGKANQDLMDWSIRAMQVMAVLFPLVSLVMNLSVVAVLWFGGRMVVAGSLEIGKIMAFINYLTQIMFSVMMVVMMSVTLTRGQVSAERLNEVLETEASIRDAAQPPGETAEASEEIPGQGSTIEFRDVSFKHHHSGEWILKHISFTVRPGESLGIIGTTGSGKSTLVSLIPRLYEATRGQVLVDGRDVREIPLKSLRNRIGMVLQESILFSGTIEDNLRFSKEDASEEELREAASAAEAWDFIQEKTEGLQAEVAQRGRNFSGGQKQRLSIARTLLRKPQILILDDAASAVDMLTEAKIREAIHRRMGQCTLLLIAQRIAAIKDADKILVMDEGCISGFGTHRELLKTNEIYRHIAVSQMGEEVLSDVG
jgi:ATP-binding cassette subfamily B protein